MGSDPLVELVARVAARLESGEAAPVRVLADDLGLSWSTCQRLHAEARRRGWLTADGAPTLEGLVACGRV